MGADTKIEWCRHTFNPWVGCSKVSCACDFCYAEAWAKRIGQPELWGTLRRRTTASYWRQPLKWDRAAAAAGERHRVFCASLADVFDNQVPTEWRNDLWELIGRTPNLDWLLLTKRPQNIAKMLPDMDKVIGVKWPDFWSWPWPNVWLGTTVENQEEAKRRIPHLKATPAQVHFLSCEPLLEDLGELDLAGIDWVICGGESGAKARPMHPGWARSLREQCAAAGVAFFFKQWGEWCPTTDPRTLGIPGHGAVKGNCEQRDIGAGVSTWRVGKKKAGRLLEGREWNEFPRAA